MASNLVDTVRFVAELKGKGNSFQKDYMTIEMEERKKRNIDLSSFGWDIPKGLIGKSLAYND